MTKEAVLQMLERGETLSGEAMSRELGISRAAIWKAISQLRQEGYTIESATNRGYRLAGRPNVLTKAGVLGALQGHPWGETLQVEATVDSTNRLAKELAAQGAAHGTVVLADHQSRGKGRLGRSFASPRGMGVYCSVILRCPVEPRRIFHLTAMAAEAARRAVREATGLEPAIKWTNDLVVGKRKLAGILTELSVTAETGTVDYVVTGIGINCCERREDFPEELRDMATSLELELGRPVDRCQVAAALIRQLDQMSQALLTDPQPWMDDYRAACITLGKDVQIIRGDSVRLAHVDGMDDQGALLVTLADGTKETVFSGEVSVRGMYGYL